MSHGKRRGTTRRGRSSHPLPPACSLVQEELDALRRLPPPSPPVDSPARPGGAGAGSPAPRAAAPSPRSSWGVGAAAAAPSPRYSSGSATPARPEPVASHVHLPACNHAAAPAGAVYAAAKAGDVRALQAALEAGASTDEADEVRGSEGGGGGRRGLHWLATPPPAPCAMPPTPTPR